MLDITPVRVRGRARKVVTAEIIRPLTATDLVLLEPERPEPPKPSVKAFRDAHHRIARCFASGMRPAEVNRQTGYSLSRLSILLADPAFQNLIEVYRAEGAEEFAEYTDLATANMIRAEQMVADALEAASDRDTPLELSELRPLMDIISDRADRFGHPKQSVSHNVNHDLAGRLEAARRRSGLVLPPKEGPK